MDLSAHWSTLELVAARRLEHNQTARQYAQGATAQEQEAYKRQIELLGAAGELAARIHLGLTLVLHTGFDQGADILWRGWKIDVKATHLTKRIEYRRLQWPIWKKIKSDFVLLMGVNLQTHEATPLGYATPQEIWKAPVNPDRDQPCHEIPIEDLHPTWKLWSLDDRKLRRAGASRHLGACPA